MGKQFVFDTCAFIHLEPYIIRLVLLSGAASKGKSLSWNFLVKIGENFKNIRFTPLEIRGTVTDISD
jgi:hypothetical protein